MREVHIALHREFLPGSTVCLARSFHSICPCYYFVLLPTITCCTPSGTLNSALMDVPSHAEIFQTAFPAESVTHQASCCQCLTSSWRSPAKAGSSDHPISAGPANPSFLEIG